jgi:threonine synthase
MDLVACFFCRKSLPHDPFSPFCPDCGEPMFVVPPEGSGPRTVRMDRALPLERYADFLPLGVYDPRLSLGEGETPFVALDKLGARLGIRGLFAKNEAQNPTGSFKDRGTALAVQKALALGFGKIGTVSTGNMAASTAAYGARAVLETWILLKEGTSRSSVQAAAIYGPVLVTVRGDYGLLFYKSLEIGRKLGIYFMNSIDPFRVEGYKVTGFEIWKQLGRRAPGAIFVPLSSGGHLIGLMRAFEDLERAGLVSRYPTFVGVQAAGCAPLARAFESGRPRYERWESVRTLAHAISNPAPPAGNAALKLIKDHGGIIVSVPDEAMLAAQASLASSEGLFCQPESAVALAGMLRLREEGRLAADSECVLVLTGSGLKSPHALDSQPLKVEEAGLGDLENRLSSLARPR